ncbi:hypothetical protein NKH18_27310 [Streptomyces sp. M10(2022)]
MQEALTNVHKHARAPRRRFISYSAREPFGYGSSTARPTGPPRRLPTVDLCCPAGHGLIGLTERVRLAGGTIESGPTDDGGFRIGAALPASEPVALTAGA